jgi:mRNA interferase HigB
MQIVTRKHLAEAAKQYPDAAREIWGWHRIANDVRWRNFVEVREVIEDADDVDGYVIFNIRRNRYRLVTIIHYAREKEGRVTMGRIYIRAFLTHRQYDNRANWDEGVKR